MFPPPLLPSNTSKKKMAEMELPLELITEILTRLPVKPLTRFKCVSKTWNFLISSPSFINHHFKSNPNPNPNIVVTSNDSNSLLNSVLIPNDDNNNLRFSELDHPLKLNNNPLDFSANIVYLLDSCNGILLITNATLKPMYLYNPANHTYRLLPPIPTRPMEYLGFGYDSHIDDYKVIRVVQNREMNVYSNWENVWRFMKDDSPSVQKCFLHNGHPFGSNGVLYFRAVTIDGKPVLMRFDLRTELFSILDYSVLDSNDIDKELIKLIELRGCLCLIVNYLSEHDPMSNLMYADVWEMRESGKEVSWVKLFRIKNSEVVGKGEQCRYLKLVTYSKDKKKLLIEIDCAWLGWYDLVTKRVTKVKTHGLLDESWRQVTTYVESLVSVSNDKAVVRNLV